MALVQISSGRGPLECAWVVARIAEAFQREAERFGLHVQVQERIPVSKGDAFKSVRFNVSGEDCERYLIQWTGVVQWIGKSPFRPRHKRKNWFVSVECFFDGIEKETPDEFKVETMRAGGPGGQHVNKTNSAVRVTHIPTQVSAISQDGRSQSANKKIAFERLQRKLNDLEDGRQMKKDRIRWNQHNRLERGNPIRIYTGDPLKRTK